MSAFPTTDETLNQPESQTETLLAEQLIEFANEAFVFAGASRPASKKGRVPERFPAPPRTYFADVASPPLTLHHLKNTRVVPSREQMLPLLPRGGVCVETGTRTGQFGWQILSALQPSKLQLCDRDFNSFDDEPFAAAVAEGIVELHEAGAAEHLAAQPDRHFDLICLHPDHSYAATARALEEAGRKLKDDGCIFCANYMTYSPLEGIKYGVVRAVNEFCHTGSFEISCLALNSLGCQDALLRKCAPPAGDAALGGASLDAPDASTFLPDVWQYLIEKYEVRSVLDVGAGAGWSTKWFSDQGIYTLGVEGWPEALARSQCRPNIVQHDYRSGPFVPSMILDLAWCAGFVEHIEEKFIPNFMASFRACRNVCLTHAEPGQPGHQHVNCQPTAYWIGKMNEAGFDFDEEETAFLLSTDKHKTHRSHRATAFFKKRQ